jgi:Fur family transcriptional regulator, zinc uptake regulator
MSPARDSTGSIENLPRNQARVLTCLKQAKEPLSAYAILDRLRNSGISHPPTVYRALDELMQKGMVHRLQTRPAFFACEQGQCDGKLALAVCHRCGKVIEIPLSGKQDAKLAGLAPHRFAVDQVALELSGLCPACRA